MMVVMTISSMIFGIFGSGELQPWDDLEQYNLKEKTKKDLPINKIL